MQDRNGCIKHWRECDCPAIALALTLAPANWAQQKPLTQDQVQGLVRSWVGRWSGANENFGMSAAQPMRRCSFTIDRVSLSLDSKAPI
jgi:hypothetical protein